jgi:hypothetical protein
MEIKFIKRHLQYNINDVVTNHPNAKYLIKVKAAIEVKEEVKKKNGKL